MAKQKSNVADFILHALKALRPPERMTVSQWAEKNRVLDARSSAIPGKWRNHVTPYLVDIMDEFNNPYTEEIVFCKPTQVGGTEVLLNAIGYMVDQEPYPAMLVFPTDKLAEQNSLLRIRPMLELCPSLKEKYDHRASNIVDYHFDGMDLTLPGANSPSGLASKPIGKLFLDEVDKYPTSTKREAAPIKLARERTKTFPNRKIYIDSTPTIRSGPIWQAMLLADEIRHFFVPCPHCGEMIELRFKQIKWPGSDTNLSIADRAELAHYVCQECGCLIDDAQKPKMLNGGKWKNTIDKTQHPRVVAFWLNTLYSPFVKWSQIAKEWMISKESPETRQNFVNSWLAEPWEDVAYKTDADLVMQRRSKYPAGVVPEWAELLTGGVDVQQNKLYYVIRAWGKYLTSQNILYGEADTLDEIEEVMNAEYAKADNGERLIVSLACIDSGFNTDEVYDFCAERRDWAMPSKGASHPMLSRSKISIINKTDSKAFGQELLIVDGSSYKDTIAARMKKENGKGSWMVHAETEMVYAEQVTSEQKVNEKKAGKTISVWRPKTSHIDNHLLDCEVYAFAAADLMHVREMHLYDEDGQQVAEDQAEADNTWTGKEDWLSG